MNQYILNKQNHFGPNCKIFWLLLLFFGIILTNYSFAGIRSVRTNLTNSQTIQNKTEPKKIKIDSSSSNSEILKKLKQFEDNVNKKMEIPKQVNNQKSDKTKNELIDSELKNSIEFSDNKSEKRLATVSEQLKLIKNEQTNLNTRITTAESDINDLKFTVNEIKEYLKNQKQEFQPSKGGERIAKQDKNEQIIQTNFESISNSNDEQILPEILIDKSAQTSAQRNQPLLKSKPTKKEIKKQISKKLKKNSELSENIRTQTQSNKHKPKTEIIKDNQPQTAQSGESNNKSTNNSINKSTNNSINKSTNKSVNNSNNSDNKSAGITEKYQALKNAVDDVNKKEFNKAISSLNKIIEKEKNPSLVADCYYYIGESHFGLKQYDKAVNYFSKVLNAKSTDKADNAQMMLAESYIRNGNVNQGKKAYQQLMDKFPQSEFIVKAKKMLQQL